MGWVGVAADFWAFDSMRPPPQPVPCSSNFMRALTHRDDAATLPLIQRLNLKGLSFDLLHRSICLGKVSG
jgi:hypothetical protein